MREIFDVVVQVDVVVIVIVVIEIIDIVILVKDTAVFVVVVVVVENKCVGLHKNGIVMLLFYVDTSVLMLLLLI